MNTHYTCTSTRTSVHSAVYIHCTKHHSATPPQTTTFLNPSDPPSNPHLNTSPTLNPPNCPLARMHRPPHVHTHTHIHLPPPTYTHSQPPPPIPPPTHPPPIPTHPTDPPITPPTPHPSPHPHLYPGVERAYTPLRSRGAAESKTHFQRLRIGDCQARAAAGIDRECTVTYGSRCALTNGLTESACSLVNNEVCNVHRVARVRVRACVVEVLGGWWWWG